MLIQDGALGLTSLGRVASAGGRPHCAGECGPQCPGLDELLRGAQDEAPARHAGGGRR